MKKAVIYARVSTKDQEREGYSIPAQLRILREYADKNRLEVVREFTESESAGKTGRSQFKVMISLLRRDSSVTELLVEKTDRLYRNFKDKVVIDDLDIEVHFVKDSRVIGKNSKSSVKFVNDIETAQARYYSNNLSEEVHKGLDQKARQGKYPGGPVPIGYLRNPLTKEIEIDPERAPLVRRLFELYATNEFSLDKLRLEAKKLGLRYRKSDGFLVKAEIHRILQRVFYTGKFPWNGQILQGDHPAIVSQELFDQVQSVFQNKPGGRGASRDFTFSRLIQCGECGHTVTAEIKKAKYIYYHCTAYGKKHKPIYVPESKVDKMMSQIVSKATLPFDFYDFLKRALVADAHKLRVRESCERDKLESERDLVKTRMRKAYEDVLDGHVDRDFHKAVHEDYQKQLEALEYRLRNLPGLLEQNIDLAMKAIELSYQAESLYLRANPQQKRKLVRSVLSNCHLRGRSLYPTYRKPFDTLVEGIESNNKRG